MSEFKWKVGDRGLYLSRCWFAGGYDGYEKVFTVTQMLSSDTAYATFPNGCTYMISLNFAHSFESSRKTYTLTPSVHPETVTIKGVEYIMTENV